MSVPPDHLRTGSALFLDFDGTLSPIQADPDKVFLPPNGMAIIQKTSDLLSGAVAIISGRDIRDLSRRLPRGIWRVGGHSAETCPPYELPKYPPPQAPQDFLEAVDSLRNRLSGIRMELKGQIIALHFRNTPEAGPALLAEGKRLLEAFPAYSIQTGKMVLELRPKGIHKGRAVQALMQHAPFAGRQPIMVGDDTTDEDAMRVCLALGGSAVHVGEGPTIAPHILPDPRSVWTWMKESLK